MGEVSRRIAKVGLGAAKLEQVLEIPEGPVQGLSVPGTDALAHWKKLRGAVATTKLWPVILGPRDEVARIDDWIVSADSESASHHEAASAILAHAEKLSATDLLAKRAAKRAADEEIPEPDYPSGSWPDAVKARSELRATGGSTAVNSSIPSDGLTNEPHKEVLVALLPTETSWHVPAFLRFGGWNECPTPSEHVALLRHWGEKYGVEVVGMTHDTLELAVARPPQEREAAIALAKQHYDYCGDVVDQGVGTIEALAAGLLDASVWSFWWD